MDVVSKYPKVLSASRHKYRHLSPENAEEISSAKQTTPSSFTLPNKLLCQSGTRSAIGSIEATLETPRKQQEKELKTDEQCFKVTMCFYSQKRFLCGDWAWGSFAAKCNHEYRMGETCGMKLVHNTENIQAICKLCEKIQTKHRRRNTEVERINRWRREGSVMKASMEKSQAMVKDFEQEISQLEHERQLKQRSIGNMECWSNVQKEKEEVSTANDIM
ncbi:uncharacterized protein ARB_05335 [Trichophyton benhamiae CBS 112371]|uniref:Uncharacterized protein n=1 Tax=Arthroderma benhamiae (strain ATCC MYA-4681 / CBS 112371) TaxID=663331 RepID=D4ALY7_ARTBC|nr:uncharacterized protein ARB_05335 [Trichophyton benhamiae CBS 112371]EFE36396.1 hypothetical protein ARB_05335 [Trichophyton benhamiae CBS 112371]